MITPLILRINRKSDIARIRTTFECKATITLFGRKSNNFITCFIALLIYRYLGKKLDEKYTTGQVIPTLQEMDFVKHEGKGWQPVYTRTELTDTPHEAFGFCTSKQIVPIKKRNICSQ